ncbi:hypothetical protein LIER_31693 [Lithospermum erythrorhizon]|uniref:Uncharacterized protein n=1 Tax=Lithospermum erythrorhizon TaxID=34254 RepID=A0AAV3RU48_LITER
MSLKHVPFLLSVFLIAQTITLATARETTHQWEGTVFADVEGIPPEKVWPFIGDFCNVYRVFPINVSFCDRGDPENIVVGNRRFMIFLNGTNVQWEKHHLVEFNPAKRFLTYRMMENNIKVSYYRSTMTVLKDKKNGSKIRWKWIANPVQGYTPQSMQAQLQFIVQFAAGNIIRLSGSS